MKKRFFYFIGPILALGSIIPFTNYLVSKNQSSLTKDIDNKATKYFGDNDNQFLNSEPIPQGWVRINQRTKEAIQNEMFRWEAESILKYETMTEGTLWNRTNFIRTFWDVVPGVDANGWTIERCTTTILKNNALDIKVTIKANNKLYDLTTETLTFIKEQSPTELLVRWENIKDSSAQEAIDSVFINPREFKRNLCFNVSGGKEDSYDSLRVIEIHNKNQKVKELYPSNIDALLVQPIIKMSIADSNNIEGWIEFNVEFSTSKLQGNISPFTIAYFDSNGEPVRFYENEIGSKVSKTFQINGFTPVTNRLSIFNGQDGEFLMWTLIAISILVVVSIIWAIIHVYSKNHIIVKKMPHVDDKYNNKLEYRKPASRMYEYQNLEKKGS